MHKKRSGKFYQPLLGVAVVVVLSAFIQRINTQIDESFEVASHTNLNGIPSDYQLLYEQDFEKAGVISAFEMSDPTAWRIHQEEDNHALELFGKSDYAPRVRSPRNIAFIKGLEVSDFVLEIDLKQTGREYGHRDMCLFFCMKDADNFYYVHLASAADEHAHNVFIVNDKPRENIAKKTTEGISWGEVESPTWHKVRLERTYKDGKIRVFFDDMQEPIMEAQDTHFDYGHIGFGSFDDTGMIDNIKIWGLPKNETKSGFFNK